MPGRKPVRHLRHLADGVLLLAIIAAFVAGVGRLPWHAAQYLTDDTPGGASLRTHLTAWWGPRELPHRGETFLEVLKERGTLEAANETVGAVLLEHRANGGSVTGLVIPQELGLMSSEVLRLKRNRTDGAPIDRVIPLFDEERIRRVSPVPVSLAEYDPALDESVLTRLGRPAIDFTYPHGRALLFPAADDKGGIYVFHTDESRSLILLLPADASPVSVNR